MTRRKIESMAEDVVQAGWDQIIATGAYDMEGNRVRSVFWGTVSALVLR